MFELLSSHNKLVSKQLRKVQAQMQLAETLINLYFISGFLIIPDENGGIKISNPTRFPIQL